jgi:hypothetical protein
MASFAGLFILFVIYIMNKSVSKKSSNKVIILRLLSFSNSIKLFHWNTRSYSLHISSDNLFNQLLLLIDSLVEILIGNSRMPCFSHSLKVQLCSDSQFIPLLSSFKTFILSLKKRDNVSNICDDIINAIDHFIYFSSFKN